MLQFILNNETIKTNEPQGLTVLDFIRYKKHLMGTKIGCREGDCGACTILVGTLENDTVQYCSMTSCLTPLANVQNKHVVTVEGVNTEGGNLTPIQSAMVEESGTQCGFCTVGFVMSMTGHCLQQGYLDETDAIAAIDGNICRCTGYKSIQRAAQRLTNFLEKRDAHGSPLDFAVENHIVPSYFSDIKNRLSALPTFQKFVPKESLGKTFGKLKDALYVAGGTDLYVQKHDSMTHSPSKALFNDKILRGVNLVNGYFEIGGAATVSDMKSSSPMNGEFASLQKYLKLVSSTPIRNMATIGGNLVNASPIGDMTVFLLALNATITLSDLTTFKKLSNLLGEREIYLKDFYKGYKNLDKTDGEILTKIRFKQPFGNYHFNFEKVSKRTHLDIASVNTAIYLKTDKDEITEAHVSMGGVAPIPLFLKQLSAFLIGKKIEQGGKIAWFSRGTPLEEEANAILQAEISPISDVRGSAAYKRLLARQLFQAHFIELFSILINP